MIFAFLMAVFMLGRGKTQGTKLGSDGDPIRQRLFASQSIKELMSRVQLDGKPGPFQTIADVSKLLDEGKKEEAVILLRSVLQIPNLETRIQLWVWSGLRELGEKPGPKAGFEVLGVVLEMPSGGAYDTLAAYVDGSARYLNFSGGAIFSEGFLGTGRKTACPPSPVEPPSLKLRRPQGQRALLKCSAMRAVPTHGTVVGRSVPWCDRLAAFSA